MNKFNLKGGHTKIKTKNNHKLYDDHPYTPHLYLNIYNPT